ncbi:MAG: hypothetical protein M3Y84_02625, partial [Acidobacteriota bacterium]|nr:hypothetical protein [Acidobacteriota bacterium]
MNNNQALIPLAPAIAGGDGGATAAGEHRPLSALTSIKNRPPEPLSDEMVATILKARGLDGWLRVARVARVLGLFTLYLFLDTYDIRATFNRRVVARLREETRAGSWTARLQTRCRELVHFSLDKLIRFVRLIVFRGGEGSNNKEARLVKQAVWLRNSLIGLGPTFIKIGQALGTRADLLPLAYVRELSTLQDQVPAFSTAEAYARIELE